MLISSVGKGNGHEKIVDWLSDVDCVKHHMVAQDGILEGTSEWLRAKEQFTMWEESDESTIPWLHGIRKLAPPKMFVDDILTTCSWCWENQINVRYQYLSCFTHWLA